MNEVYLTRAGLEDLKRRHEDLVVNKRKEVAERIKIAREFGDLSENFEYKAAKREKNRNDSRIRYLERMIRTAKVIAPQNRGEGVVGLFDQVTVYNEKLGREMTFRIVTTLRQDTGKGLISKESPVGRALLGKKVGDRALVRVSDDLQYYMEIRAVEKGEDDPAMAISSY